MNISIQKGYTNTKAINHHKFYIIIKNSIKIIIIKNSKDYSGVSLQYVAIPKINLPNSWILKQHA